MFWPLVLAALIVGCDSQWDKQAADEAAVARLDAPDARSDNLYELVPGGEGE